VVLGFARSPPAYEATTLAANAALRWHACAHRDTGRQTPIPRSILARMKTNARLACLLIVLALLAACGNKGPLVLPPPDEQSAAQ
jgi:hypothetical protein